MVKGEKEKKKYHNDGNSSRQREIATQDLNHPPKNWPSDNRGNLSALLLLLLRGPLSMKRGRRIQAEKRHEDRRPDTARAFPRKTLGEEKRSLKSRYAERRKAREREKGPINARRDESE